ncbi:MAG: flavodoxin domain-containing protein [Candidatus Heimdallarchaeota archaeon]
MDQPKILIAYGSRYGCTEEISIKIADFLQEKELLTAKVVNLRTTPEEFWPIPDDYQGVLLGTGIRIGKWTTEVESFLNRVKSSYFTEKGVIGFFISCGYAADPKHYPIAVRTFLEKKFNEMAIQPDIYEAFGGIFDFSSSSRIKSIDKQILKWGSRDLHLEIDYGNYNDYRNWGRIFDFSHSFAELARKSIITRNQKHSLVHSN